MISGPELGSLPHWGTLWPWVTPAALWVSPSTPDAELCILGYRIAGWLSAKRGNAFPILLLRDGVKGGSHH